MSEEQRDGLKRVITFIVIVFSACVIAMLAWGMMFASEDY